MTPLALTVRRQRRGAFAALAALALWSGCQQAAGSRPAATPVDATAVVPLAAPPADATAAADLPGLHNVVTYAPGCLSGGLPEGEPGMRTLVALGVRTVVSVDGGAPDTALAAAHGLRYVHLPISYDGVSAERRQELAQVLASLPGPIYMHCHHGKHRSAAALASAAVVAGKLSVEQALARMQVSGTAADYRGLWQAVREAAPLPAAALQRDPAAFPSVSVVSGLVATMAEIDAVFDNLKQVQQAGWAVPKDHPDLVAAKESKRLHALFAQLDQDLDSRAQPDSYQRLLQQALELSQSLDAAVRAGDATTAEQQFQSLQKSCKACHKDFRDNA